MFPFLLWINLIIPGVGWVWRCCTGHGNIVAAKEEEEPVGGHAEQVEEEDQLDRALGLQLEFFQNVPAEENSDTGSRDCCAPSQHTEEYENRYSDVVSCCWWIWWWWSTRCWERWCVFKNKFFPQKFFFFQNLFLPKYTFAHQPKNFTNQAVVDSKLRRAIGCIYWGFASSFTLFLQYGCEKLFGRFWWMCALIF